MEPALWAERENAAEVGENVRGKMGTDQINLASAYSFKPGTVVYPPNYLTIITNSYPYS